MCSGWESATYLVVLTVKLSNKIFDGAHAVAVCTLHDEVYDPLFGAEQLLCVLVVVRSFPLPPLFSLATLTLLLPRCMFALPWIPLF